MKIGFVSLGCDKNRVDTEKAMGILSSKYEIVSDPSVADIIVINTCGFIESAKVEAIDAIFEMAEYKKKNCSKLVVMGCLAERYYEDIKAIPEVDCVIRLSENESIGRIIDELVGECEETVPPCGRVLSTPYHYAYLKIADGCSNRCTYCAIPSIRGKYKSFDENALLDEAKALRNDYNVRELIVVAQDTTRYGTDNGKTSLIHLLESLTNVGFDWIRLMYCYPECVTMDLISFVSQNDSMCKYMDIPFQHIDDAVLRSMGRRNTEYTTRKLLDDIRETDERIAVRSSFIVGFPTETEEAFGKLCGFIREAGLIAGFFKFSSEEGTPAAKLRDLPDRTKKQRLREIERIQSSVLDEMNRRKIGNTYKVLYEGIDYKKQAFYGRTMFSAPDIDPVVLFKADFPLNVGEFYNVKITGTDGLNLVGGIDK